MNNLETYQSGSIWYEGEYGRACQSDNKDKPNEYNFYPSAAYYGLDELKATKVRPFKINGLPAVVAVLCKGK